VHSFLVREHYSGGQDPTALMAELRDAPHARVGELELAAAGRTCSGFVATIRTVNKQIKDLEHRIRDQVRAHPDGRIVLSLFKSPNSVITAAELLAEIGDCRQRYLTRDALAANAGHAAVAEEFGKRRTASFRWGCNKRLRIAFCRLADSSRHWHPWPRTSTPEPDSAATNAPGRSAQDVGVREPLTAHYRRARASEEIRLPIALPRRTAARPR
jgi:transposase